MNALDTQTNWELLVLNKHRYTSTDYTCTAVVTYSNVCRSFQFHEFRMNQMPIFTMHRRMHKRLKLELCFFFCLTFKRNLFLHGLGSPFRSEILFVCYISYGFSTCHLCYCVGFTNSPLFGFFVSGMNWDANDGKCWTKHITSFYVLFFILHPSTYKYDWHSIKLSEYTGQSIILKLISGHYSGQ